MLSESFQTASEEFYKAIECVCTTVGYLVKSFGQIDTAIGPDQTASGNIGMVFNQHLFVSTIKKV